MQTPSTQITISQGEIRGEMASPEGIRVFRGIPFAKPPTGELRFRPPQVPVSWRGVRDATQFSASCSQATFTSGFVWRRGDFATSEDCLYLNVWSHESAESQPVMVWFHGGAHTSGQGHAAIFNGTTLAQQGVVLVTINYRLGPLGFLAHPWLAEESDFNAAGNYGLMDKIAALNWVRDNIAQLGGDPNNVTIFGQSAGSQSVCSLMTSAMAQGLFHKAIGQSAACVGPAPHSDADGRLRGQQLVAATSAKNLSELRKLPADQLLKAADATGWAGASRIVVDGWVLPEAQVAVFARGGQHKVPLMLGSLANEGVELLPRNDALTLAEFDTFTTSIAGEFAAQLKAAYAEDLAISPGHAHHAINADLFMTFGMRRWAEYNLLGGQPTYLYFMDHVPPAFHLYMPEDPLLDLAEGPRSAGAYHSGDLAYVFGNTRKVGMYWQEDDHALSAQMVKYWTNFAKNGDPNSQDLPSWAGFDANNFTTQLLRPNVKSVPGVRRKALTAMAKANPMP